MTLLCFDAFSFLPSQVETGRRLGTTTAAKSQGSETCVLIGGRKLYKRTTVKRSNTGRRTD